MESEDRNKNNSIMGWKNAKTWQIPLEGFSLEGSSIRTIWGAPSHNHLSCSQIIDESKKEIDDLNIIFTSEARDDKI